MNDAHTQILVDAAKRGDRGAFRLLYDRYGPVVFRVAYRMLGNRFDAEEVTQDVFVRIFRKIDTFYGRAHFQTWTLKIAVNTCYDRLRVKKRRAPYQADLHEDESNADSVGNASDGDRADHLAIADDVRRYVKQALNAMHEDLRVALVLRDIEDLPYDEISRIMSCSMGTVASRIARARKQISAHLLTVGIDANYFSQS